MQLFITLKKILLKRIIAIGGDTIIDIAKVLAVTEKDIEDFTDSVMKNYYW